MKRNSKLKTFTFHDSRMEHLIKAFPGTIIPENQKYRPKWFMKIINKIADEGYQLLWWHTRPAGADPTDIGATVITFEKEEKIVVRGRLSENRQLTTIN